MSDRPIKHLVIVGGGTAGWLTAGVIAADHCARAEDGLSVTVIESPTIPILGVGEGTWPSLRDTLRRIGIKETEFIRRCNASFKQGSQFCLWNTGDAEDRYFHPFEAPPSADRVDAQALWKSGPAGAPFAFSIGSQAAVCSRSLAPKQIVTPEYAGVSNYAYHLDAPAFAEMLREHCTDRLGVAHIVDNVTEVHRGDDGGIEALGARQSGRIDGDLFVDCTGGRALLIGDALGVKLRDVSDVLFNDAALAVQAPYESHTEAIASQTNATAMRCGWVWDIALRTRRGIGYVFSTNHVDEASARAELSAYLEKYAAGAGVSGEDARLIKFRSAYREAPWTKNVIAIGMSQGFVEPLEASAIVMIELAAAMLSDTLPSVGAAIPAASARFNRRFAYRWSRIVEFLKLHYVLSKRPEPYWSDHRQHSTLPDRLRECLEQWKYAAPSREDFTDALEIFPAASYAYILYGMGFETSAASRRNRKAAETVISECRREIESRTAKLLSALPTNRVLLDHIASKGLTTV